MFVRKIPTVIFPTYFTPIGLSFVGFSRSNYRPSFQTRKQLCEDDDIYRRNCNARDVRTSTIKGKSERADA